MAEEIFIRPMTRDDVPEVSALEREIFSDPWTEQGFYDSLDVAGTIFLVAQRGGEDSGGEDPGIDDCGGKGCERIVGYCGLYTSDTEAMIANVGVCETDRRKGVARAMLKRLIGMAERQGVRQIFLEVRASNEAAISLYSEFGFVPYGIRRDFYRLPREDALCMTLSIT